MSALSPEACF